MRIIVSQKGAREHFLAARALHRQGMLAALVTDWYAVGNEKAETLKTENLKAEKSQRLNISAFQRICLPAFQHFSVSVFQLFVRRSRAALSARSDEIPDDLVHAFPFRTLFWKWRERRLAAQGRSHEAFLQTDSAFASKVASLRLPDHNVFFGYSYASLETLRAEKARGIITVLDQIDPGPVEFRLVAEEMVRNPGLAGPPLSFPTAYYDRLRREWELADVLVVNSEWSRDAIIAEGADASKIEVLPLAFEENAEKLKTAQWSKEQTPQAKEVRGQKSEVRVKPQSGNAASSGPVVGSPVVSSPPRTLRVLWLGQVNVRKGIHYLMEAARLLERENVHFDVVGAIGILPAAVASAPKNMTFHGSVSRDRAAEWYRQSDVFVLPTLSDGFALTQLEALAHGVPVITTPNCGRVVEDGKTGFIVPPRDAQALADAIRRFVRNPKLAAEMSPRCIEASKAFSIEAYGKRLVEIIQKHAGKR